MFSAKINCFFVALILSHDLKVYHLQTAPKGSIKLNQFTRDDVEIHPEFESQCLIKSFEVANKLRCLTACNMDGLCYMIAHGGSTCSLYDNSAVNYFLPKPSNNEKNIYVKK